ncbi:hypothetical protein H8356DRAFT_1052812 [Neocallimastix lanati (nom. inval.)]|jgi:hypothetical protein|uniref:BTB domain-containing protein n=1 Tax=Neocallimastix californiae TaxID=1754190 RepID=A0A1Y1ZV17_9FUNG|nr:hypothetical protein H8356DRAFT_1052812 [Neocallimastix sp. JGI-2020a]ORY14099.1 hypothetical protein LY90DRAFT_518079 [Neocallimastix californiae]|eukprot:ORY14099.1 hypothetical protein LY90DRAFT_518079 [Neocallimastix californiae]
MSTTLNEIYAQLPSPPLSPNNELCFSECLFDQFIYTDEELKNIGANLNSEAESPVESPVELSKDDILRNKYVSLMEDGVEINEEIVPYLYAIEKLHSIGNIVINKKTKDAIPLRVFETGTDKYQEFWVHPMFLSLQSFQFFKLFEEVKENNEQGVIEIEIPSLKSFAIVLYYLYTGDKAKLLKVAKMEESLCKGIMENIECLEINMEDF